MRLEWINEHIYMCSTYSRRLQALDAPCIMFGYLKRVIVPLNFMVVSLCHSVIGRKFPK